MTAAPLPSLRVVKVGGSLFTWPELPRALRVWLAHQPPAVNVLLAGGGELADAIRRADAALGLGEAAAHWLCIEALGVTAHMLAEVLGGPSSVVRSLSELQQRIGNGRATAVVVDPREFLQREEGKMPGAALPHNWSATSDSIAARLATAIGANELVLLKSADPPPQSALAELAARDYVDRHFPLVAGELMFPVRIVNLRCADQIGREH